MGAIFSQLVSKVNHQPATLRAVSLVANGRWNKYNSGRLNYVPILPDTMSLSILIVDDNLSLANLYQIVFERNDWLVQRVSSGQEALASIALDVPDVVLLDVMMPDMDVIEVCRRIREHHPTSPPCIAVYTANNRPEVREASLAAGANLFFSKNLSVFELPAEIAAHF